MTDDVIKSPTLDDLMTVNEELTALVGAGVPLELETTGREVDLAAMYARFSATLGRRISHGQTLAGALRESNEEMPRSYRSLMLLGLRFDQLDLALDSSRALAATADESRFIVRAGLIYPLLVAALAYLGMVAFLWWLVPLLVSTYDVPGMTLGSWLSALNALRASLPYWVAIPPAILLITVARRGWRRGVRGRPRRRHADPLHLSSRLRYAQFAEICAELLRSGVSKPEAIELAAGASGAAPAGSDDDLTPGARRTAVPPRSGAWSTAGFPPLLTYALADGLTDADCSLALRAAASAYRQSAEIRQDKLQRWVPLLLLIFVGGGIVAIYGLMLFLPLAELLEALSLPR